MNELTAAPGLAEPAVTVAWSSFLIRCFREGEDGEWRGEVVHLQTQARERIGTLAQIAEFLAKHMPEHVTHTPGLVPQIPNSGNFLEE